MDKIQFIRELEGLFFSSDLNDTIAKETIRKTKLARELEGLF